MGHTTKPLEKHKHYGWEKFNIQGQNQAKYSLARMANRCIGTSLSKGDALGRASWGVLENKAFLDSWNGKRSRIMNKRKEKTEKGGERAMKRLTSSIFFLFVFIDLSRPISAPNLYHISGGKVFFLIT